MSEKVNPLKKLWRLLPFVKDPQPLVTVVDLAGVIGAAGPGRSGLSLKKVEKALAAAFKPDQVDAVALLINSPGGSPVQSRLIYSEIRRLAAENDTPVFAFLEDVGASGGYILAVAGDEIYADESSIVGSIGVISGGFGFHEAIARLGIERRVYTAGDNKSTLDPFVPENPADIARLETILADLHEQFIDLVKERRGDKLADNPELFTGAIWTGKAAIENGLIDGTARFNEYIRTRYGKDVKIKKISTEGGSFLKKLLSGGDAFGARSLLDADQLLDTAERRALWARFGL